MKRTVLWVAGLAVGLMACGRVNKDLSDRPDYAVVMGHYYQTKIELGVYRFKGEKGVQVSSMNDHQTFPQRDKIKPPFPIRYYDTIVLGILPAGSEFQVVQVKDQGSTGMSFIHYFVKIMESSDSQWVGQIVDADLISVERVPKFKPEYVEELAPK